MSEVAVGRQRRPSPVPDYGRGISDDHPGRVRSHLLRQRVGRGAAPVAPGACYGLMMTLWVGLFVAQVMLISAKRVRLHQRLGYSAIGLAVLIIATGLPTALAPPSTGQQRPRRAFRPLSFLIGTRVRPGYVCAPVRWRDLTTDGSRRRIRVSCF